MQGDIAYLLADITNVDEKEIKDIYEAIAGVSAVACESPQTGTDSFIPQSRANIATRMLF